MITILRPIVKKISYFSHTVQSSATGDNSNGETSGSSLPAAVARQIQIILAMNTISVSAQCHHRNLKLPTQRPKRVQ
jgi:hypothetical protein